MPEKLKPLSKIRGYRKLDKNFQLTISLALKIRKQFIAYEIVRVKRVFPLLKNVEVPTLLTTTLAIFQIYFSEFIAIVIAQLAIPYAFGYVNRFRAYEIARIKRFPAPQLLKTKSSKKLYVEVPTLLAITLAIFQIYFSEIIAIVIAQLAISYALIT